MPARAHLPVSAYFPGHGTASALPYTDPDGSFMSADNLIGGRWLGRFRFVTFSILTFLCKVSRFHFFYTASKICF